MVQVWGCDDMLSLHNFYVNIITFGVHKATYAARKARKLKKKAKTKIVSRLHKNVARFGKGKMHCLDIQGTCHDGKNVTQCGETLI